MKKLCWSAVVVFVVSSCSSESPLAPEGTLLPTGNTFTVTGAGVRPSVVRIRMGDRVIFTNDDTVNHEMSSDDHPLHVECPAINQVGYLRPGETRETGNFVTVETCAFHDHLDPTNASFWGTIDITE